VFTFRIEYRTPFQIKINQLHNLLKLVLFCSAAFFGLSIQAFGGTNNQVQKAESETNSSVATELNKLKESSALSPEERARIRRALAAYAKSSGKESSLKRFGIPIYCLR